MSDVRFICPHCQQKLEASGSMQGTTVTCPGPQCGRAIHVPLLPSISPPPTSPQVRSAAVAQCLKWGTGIVAICVVGLISWGVLDYLKHRDQVREPAAQHEDRKDTQPVGFGAELSQEVKTLQVARQEKRSVQSIAAETRNSVMALSAMNLSGEVERLGTGFIISSDGRLVTNYHVIEGASQIVAKHHTGGAFRVVSVLGTDKEHDIALLKLDAMDLPCLPLGDSGQVRQGDRILIIGSPHGLEGTLSEGLVSALRGTAGKLTSLQFTAAISPGSSGSPVVDSAGQVIGVATCTIKDGQALNFAVPVNVVGDLLRSVQTRSDAPNALYPVCVSGRYGYVNRRGEMVIEPQYGVALEFSEGLAYVRGVSSDGTRVEGAYYIDTNGEIVIDMAQYQPGIPWEAGGDFSEGLVVFHRPDDKWGFLDKAGSVAIAYRFDFASFFSEGLAYVEIGDKFGYIDRTGALVITPRFEVGSSDTLVDALRESQMFFRHGLAKVKHGGKYGFIDGKGRWIVRPLFDDAKAFSGNGMAPVKQGDEWGYINRKGEFAIRPRFSYTWGFAEGLAAVWVSGRYGFINETGHLVIPAKFGSHAWFKEGLAAVLINDKYGYINQSGKVVIEPIFEYAYSFSSGLARVQLGNTDYDEIIQTLEDPNYVPTAQEEPATGYIDHEGNYVWMPTR